MHYKSEISEIDASIASNNYNADLSNSSDSHLVNVGVNLEASPIVNTTKSETPSPLNPGDIVNITLDVIDDIPIVVWQDSKKRNWIRT